jgi:membrane-associated phospholipid phosphatase
VVRGKAVGIFVFAGIVLVATEIAHAQEPSPLPPAKDDLSRFLPKDFVEDGRRTMADFPRNLGRSFVGVFAKDNVGPLVFGVAATGVAWRFDQTAQTTLGGRAQRFGETGATMGGLTVMAPFTLTLFATGRIGHNGPFRAFSYDATQAIIVDEIYTEIFKKAVSRTRPDGSDKVSFPSGHASTAFALATVAQRHYGWKVGVPSYLAASAIGLSRIEYNRHYFSDVLAGATLGIITGRTVVRTNGETVGRRRSLSFAPLTDAQGTGVGMGASVSW